jgi:hypothetical protein
MTWKENLIKLYFYISEDRGIQRYLSGMRMSNNYKPLFTDEEVMTVYIYLALLKVSVSLNIFINILNAICPTGFPCFQAIKPLMTGSINCLPALKYW